MNFLYVDESGTPAFTDPYPVFAIVGVDVDESKGRSLIYEYTKLKKYYFPALYTTKLRNLSTIEEKIKLLKKREQKGILKPREFCYPYRTFMYKVINLCLKYNVKIFNITAFKDKLKRRDPRWLYPACLKILTGIYNRYLEQNGSRGIIIMDSRGQGWDDTMTFIQSSYLLWGKKGKQFDRVIDLPFFTRSHLSLILQIAHYFAYITAMQYYCVYYKQSQYNYLTCLWKRLSVLFYGTPKGKEIIRWS